MRRRWWSISGGLLAIAAFAWIGYLVDPYRMLAVARAADPLFLLIFPFAVCLDLLVRAWKWRKLLLSLKPVGTSRLYEEALIARHHHGAGRWGIRKFYREIAHNPHWLIGNDGRVSMSKD